MNKHTKLAIFVAPVLIILGYASSDFYMEYKAGEDKLFSLVVDGSCDILAETCILKAGEFEVNIFDRNGVTTVNSTYPLDSATLFLVETDNSSTAYPLGMSDSAYYWRSPTPLRENIQTVSNSQKIRLIANIKGGKYISEFVTTTN